ncbi:MAG: DUF1080 domain-containing protein [Bacteroidota bacterium]
MKKRLTIHLSSWTIFSLMILFTACGGTNTEAEETAAGEEGTNKPEVIAHNTLTEAEKADGWQLLFNGKDLEGWRGYLKDTIGSSWRVEDDAIYLHADVQEDWKWLPEDGGFIMTEKEYENFELRLQWKITDCGNSGIIYHIVEDEKYGEAWQTGLEMQVLDNKCHPDGKIVKHRAGDLYDLVAADPVMVKPAGEWNDIRIICDGNKVVHWMNGEKVVEIERFSDEWNELMAMSKFAPANDPGGIFADFGGATKGYIALQDHNDSKVWYRNIKIKAL